MYSPKVSEDLVPRLYKLAKEQKRPMTKVLDNLIRDKLVEKVKDKLATTESTTLPKIKSKKAV
ncbi:MAG: hypothetical protein AMQ74_01913 [Candidatus Methanofastidiosum methylothiophilum]|uniref:Ribbon-helix-helix protein CopG domain-containing protein n=1 Tax=Candidatus Methanofastidiosum methylothiophilum TaxID=1705564 RepID=A0A150IJS1_9EURY|nr:MAG: hypothetical protein AMQ74_01913 [Candidatus Methanofastidiosum methylthiophilus]